MADTITYITGSVELLPEIKPLWKCLNEHHAKVSPYFSEDFQAFTFEQRIRSLNKKYEGGQLRIDIAIHQKIPIGYLISTINKEKDGEIESVFIQESFRGEAIGNELMKRALKWLDSEKVETKVVNVAVGNEAVYPFYARFGFFPRVTTLRQQNFHENC